MRTKYVGDLTFWLEMGGGGAMRCTFHNHLHMLYVFIIYIYIYMRHTYICLSINPMTQVVEPLAKLAGAGLGRFSTAPVPET